MKVYVASERFDYVLVNLFGVFRTMEQAKIRIRETIGDKPSETVVDTNSRYLAKLDGGHYVDITSTDFVENCYDIEQQDSKKPNQVFKVFVKTPSITSAVAEEYDTFDSAARRASYEATTRFGDGTFSTYTSHERITFFKGNETISVRAVSQ
ncbi:MAG: hypothetical protein JZU67_03105 [Burkholderiaceae bacterium]|nr:hypothetical protein [Burkholderiaceae bacterium]